MERNQEDYALACAGGAQNRYYDLPESREGKCIALSGRADGSLCDNDAMEIGDSCLHHVLEAMSEMERDGEL